MFKGAQNESTFPLCALEYPSSALSPLGGSAVKFCLVAEGSADIYPRLSPTSEWDVAAGHALVMAAGGIVTRPDGTALTYGNVAANFRVPGFVAIADPAKAAMFMA